MTEDGGGRSTIDRAETRQMACVANGYPIFCGVGLWEEQVTMAEEEADSLAERSLSLGVTKGR
jgi:hypothetical protein